VHWVASLFLPCLAVGWSIGEALAGMMGQIEIPVDTELCSAVWDYGFPVWLRNPGELSFAPFGSEAWWGWAAALLMWLVCCWVGSRAGWFPVGAVKSFGKPYSIESSLAVGGTCALCYSRHNFQYPIAGNFLGMADGPIWRPKPTGRHSCPAPHWNLGSRAEPLLKTYFRAFLHHRNRNW